MQIKKPERFLKVAACGIGLAVIVSGFISNDKNSTFATKIDANLNAASATNLDNYSIATKIGVCEQTSVAQPNENIFVATNNLDTFLSGSTTLDLQFIDPVAAAVKGQRLKASVLTPGKLYEFTVTDGQTSFWKCVFTNHPLFTVVKNEAQETSEFLSKTQLFTEEVEKYAYAIGGQKKVEQFLNFVSAPNNETILETTALNSAGEVFFKVFEMEKTESNYNELRQLLRSRVGVTNLRPSVFGPDSYYWMWGENNNMAASVFEADGRIFGVSYQTIHFKSIRRMIDSFQSKVGSLTEQVDFVKGLNPSLSDLNVAEFANMTEQDFGPEVWRQLQDFKSGASNLSASILDIAPTATEGATEIKITVPSEPELSETNLTTTETVETNNLEPLTIPEITENPDELIPASL